nr:strawberry notch C-terminal domain-containing protein [Bradyrhizobium sp. 35]
MVAEVTGRSRRIVRKGDRLVVENRAGSANLAETLGVHGRRQAGPRVLRRGRHGEELSCRAVGAEASPAGHYLLEPGWKADAAIQGLGRTKRTNRAQPPLFRPFATDVKAEKRFLSTIARRLDTLRAITRGQRQTGGHGLFRPEDNLENQ